MSLITDKRLIFVAGCDGAGKTSVAAALALLASRRGQRVLVVSADAENSLGYAFDWQIGEQGAAVCAGVHALEINPVTETASFERVCSLIDDAEEFYDVLIFDAAPLAQTQVVSAATLDPEVLERCQHRFKDSENTAWLLVATSEQSVINEVKITLNTWQEYQLPIYGVLLNRVVGNAVVTALPTDIALYQTPLMTTPIHGIGTLQQVTVALDQAGL